MITESDAIKFQELFEKEAGEKITLEESFEMAESLVEMIRLVYKPLKRGSAACTEKTGAV